MPDRRGRKGTLTMTEQQAADIWRDREEVARNTHGVGLLRDAARILGHDEEAVDELLRRGQSGRQSSAE